MTRVCYIRQFIITRTEKARRPQYLWKYSYLLLFPSFAANVSNGAALRWSTRFPREKHCNLRTAPGRASSTPELSPSQGARAGGSWQCADHHSGSQENSVVCRFVLLELCTVLLCSVLCCAMYALSWPPLRAV